MSAAICRVITGVSGSLRNLPTLRYATALAQDQGATLVPLMAWEPPGGEVADRRCPSGHLRSVCKDSAWQRLWAVLEGALGGVPADVATEPLVVRGEAGPVLVRAASQAGDLLVIGTGRRGSIRRLAGGWVSRYCLAHAGCPVLAVPPSPLELEAGHSLHGWAFRHRRLTSEDLTGSGNPAGQS